MIEPETSCWCDECGEELPSGSFAYLLDGQWYCADCLAAYARRRFVTELRRVE